MRFRKKRRTWSLFVPSRILAAASPPMKLNRDVFGRAELCIGRLGAGKTTYAALRARRLARRTGADRDPSDPQYHNPPGQYEGRWLPNGRDRELFTTGEGWLAPWRGIGSWDELFRVENAVVVLDEVHILAPSTRGLLPPDDERKLVKWFSLCRKHHVCVVATTQSWSRVATHYRQLVTVCWICEPRIPGRLHVAYAHDIPEDGGREIWSPQWYKPAAAAIPTNAGVWTPWMQDAEAGAALPPGLAPTTGAPQPVVWQ